MFTRAFLCVLFALVVTVCDASLSTACADGTHTCDAHASCWQYNTYFLCVCNAGYSGDGQNCTDLGECDLELDGCHAQATSEDGQNFTDLGEFELELGTNINECTAGAHNCDGNATCTDTIGSFTCACNSGYSGDGQNCTNVNECTEGTHNCHAQATCTDIVGSFTCACNAGYTGDGQNCTDNNECTLFTDTCDGNAICTNTEGSFTCACRSGWTGSGLECEEVEDRSSRNAVLFSILGVMVTIIGVAAYVSIATMAKASKPVSNGYNLVP